MAVLALGLLAAACANAAQVPVVDLSERSPVTMAPDPQQSPLRVGVAAILTPESNLASYGGLVDHLSLRLQREVLLVQRRTYAEVNALLESGGVDIAFVCTSAYVAGVEDFGLVLLAAPEIDGATVYYSELIVHEDSDATSIDDLRGGVFAFTDPMSTTGRLYPTRLVRDLGHDPETFFGRAFFTYSHEDAIRAVAAGVADGAAVDSLVLKGLRAQEPDLPVRVIHRSPPFGIPPVVASPHLDEPSTATIRQLLLELGDDQVTRSVLGRMGVDRFTLIDDDAYDSVRALLAAVATDL